uniref:C2H2-type domain-containing protein n=1 Tax=Ciona savignyi TaxID=51511 RepID=H2Z2D0_CIOSA
TKEEPLDEVIPKRRTPSVKFHKRNLKRKITPPESATSETEEQPPPKVPRVHIKKLAEKYTVSCESDVSDESEKADVSTTSTSSSKVAKPTTAGDGTTKIYKTKCPSCHLVFTAVNDYNRHHKSVCHAEGIEICVHGGSDLSMTDAVEVDETGDPPPLLETENKKREDAENNCEEFVPRSPGGKRLFRRGTRIMHRWQTPKGGSRWYSGKILRLLPSKGAKAEYEVEYTDDAGPYAVTLGDDYPHDIRVITR